MENDTSVFVGLDVQKDSITAPCVGGHPSDQLIDLGALGTQQYAIDRFVKKLSGRGTVRFVYLANASRPPAVMLANVRRVVDYPNPWGFVRATCISCPE
jgi:hypothetical protein